MKLYIEKTYRSKIPVLEIVKDDGIPNKPLLIILHGLSEYKEKMLPHGYYFANEGYFVCLIDAYMHGELKHKKMSLNDYYSMNNFFDIHKYTAVCLNKIIDSYDKNQAVDNRLTSLIGISLGAMIIYKYLSDYYSVKVKVAVPIVGSPVWYNMSKSYHDSIKSKKNIEYIKGIEPIKNMNNINSVALMMINTENDEIISKNEVYGAYKLIKNNYKNKNYIKYIEYKKLGHVVIHDMLKKANKWIKSIIRAV